MTFWHWLLAAPLITPTPLPPLSPLPRQVQLQSASCWTTPECFGVLRTAGMASAQQVTHAMHGPCRQAGRWQESARILQQLNDNAVLQRQYALAASLHYQLAMEALEEVCTAFGRVLCCFSCTGSPLDCPLSWLLACPIPTVFAVLSSGPKMILYGSCLHLLPTPCP